MLIKSSIARLAVNSVAMPRKNYAKMTTHIPGTQVIYGTGDTTNNILYISQNGSWLAADGVYTASVTLTSAQILALHTTPIQIIPAPGTGKLIVISSVTYKGTGAYTNAGGSGLVYHGTSVAADESFAAPADPWINGTVLSGRLQTQLDVTTALGLAVDVSGVAADPTVGTTPATVTATYRILTP